VLEKRRMLRSGDLLELRLRDVELQDRGSVLGSVIRLATDARCGHPVHYFQHLATEDRSLIP
jgi:hypothetical protein